MNTTTAFVTTGQEAGREVPYLCSAMLEPPGGVNPLSDWLLLYEKCMEPARFVLEFWCENGHYAQNVKCAPHSLNDGSQMCGFCADVGQRVPGTVRILREL